MTGGAQVLREAWASGLGPVGVALLPMVLLFALPLPGHVRPRLVPLQALLLHLGFSAGALVLPPLWLAPGLAPLLSPRPFQPGLAGVLVGLVLVGVLVLRLRRGKPWAHSLLLVPLGALLAWLRLPVEGPVLAALDPAAGLGPHMVYWLCVGAPLALAYVLFAWLSGWGGDVHPRPWTYWMPVAWVGAAVLWALGPAVWWGHEVLLHWPLVQLG